MIFTLRHRSEPDCLWRQHTQPRRRYGYATPGPGHPKRPATNPDPQMDPARLIPDELFRVENTAHYYRCPGGVIVASRHDLVSSFNPNAPEGTLELMIKQLTGPPVLLVCLKIRVLGFSQLSQCRSCALS